MKQHVDFGSKRIDFTLRFVNRKSLTIKVHPDVSIEVLAPKDADKSKILAKVKRKSPWILKQIEQFYAYKPRTKPRRYISGETHLYLGRQYRLKVIPDNHNVVKAYRGQLFIHTLNANKDALEKQLQQWYRQKAERIFTEMMTEVLPKFKKYKIQQPAITVRSMNKRWGSCTPSGKIILNTELIKAPKGSIEYVIIHELAHLVHHNHTKLFFELQERIMPDWEKWKNRLEYSLC
jgi:predicted metal-dependent hydrolase